MKFLRITTNYPLYIKKFYLKHPELLDKPYEEQKRAIDYDAFGWADFWGNALEPLGYEVTEVVANAEPLQKMWAKGNGIKYSSDNWLLEIAKVQIERIKPEVLFVDDCTTFTRNWILEVRKSIPSLKLVLGWCGAPLQDESVLNAYDVVLSNIPELVERFRAIGCRSEHINHAFDPRILDRIDLKREPTIDFSFIGGLVRQHKFHLEREKLLKRIVKLAPIEIFSPAYEMDIFNDLKSIAAKGLYVTMRGLNSIGISREMLKKIPCFRRVAEWRAMPLSPINPALSPYIKTPVFGLQMFQTLRDSKVTFNSHIAISVNSASNMRLFEATGVGTCLLTDWKENLKELFEPEKEVVTYRSADECGEKVKWLLEHPEERSVIARKGQERTLKDHTFSKRAFRLDEIIKDYIKNCSGNI